MMQSSTNTSPLLNHAVKIRAKNVELRKQITQLQSDIQSIDNEISTLTKTHENLLEQCQILREKQTDDQKHLLLEQYETEFKNYIHDIENFINNKQWNSPSVDKSIISCKRTINNFNSLLIFFLFSSIEIISYH